MEIIGTILNSREYSYYILHSEAKFSRLSYNIFLNAKFSMNVFKTSKHSPAIFGLPDALERNFHFTWTFFIVAEYLKEAKNHRFTKDFLGFPFPHIFEMGISRRIFFEHFYISVRAWALRDTLGNTWSGSFRYPKACMKVLVRLHAGVLSGSNVWESTRARGRSDKKYRSKTLCCAV